MRLGVKDPGRLFDSRMGGPHQLQQLVQPGVHIRFRNFAVFHGRFQLPDGVPTLKAPVPAEDVLEQVLVLVGVGAVDEVVGGHDGPGLCLFDHDFKAGKIQLPQGALVQDRVTGHPAQLLAVGSKMLGAGGNAVFLDAPYIACRHFSREERVF